MRRIACFAIPALLCIGGATAAEEQAPPLCDDESYVMLVKRQYEFADSLRDSPQTINGLSQIQELAYGPSPEELNRYATATTYAANSRFCSATLTLGNGETDQLFWRLDYLVDGEAFAIHYDHCSTRHDTFQDDCIDYRAQ